MKDTNILSKLLVLFGLMVFSTASVWGDNQCTYYGTTNHTFSTSGSKTYSGTLSKYKSISYYKFYYFKVPSTGGTLTFTDNNSKKNIHYFYNEDSCPSGEQGDTSLSNGDTISLSSANDDVNILVYNSSSKRSKNFNFTITFTPTTNTSDSSFQKIFSQNIYGNYQTISSSVECVEKNNGSCNLAYTGNLFDATTKYVNSVSAQDIPLNSSTETLSLPGDINGSDILYAGLYWQGHVAGTNANNYNTTSNMQNENKVDLIDPNGTLHAITADKLWSLNFKGNGTGSNGGYRSFYQGYKDVTTIVQNSYNTDHTNNFTVGNIKANEGADNYQYASIDGQDYSGFKFGYWGNWTLVVVYAHPNPTQTTEFRNVTLFQGFKPLIPISQNGGDITRSITLSLSGFLTPKENPVNATMFIYGAAGDRNLDYDSLQIQNKKTSNLASISNTANPEDNIFNDTISNSNSTSVGNYYPGLDADEFDVSSYMDTLQTSTELKLSAKFIGNSGDQFLPGFVGFSTQLYVPKFCYDYSYSQNGIFFTENNPSGHDPRLVGTVTPNMSQQPVKMKIYLKNLVPSDINVTDMNLSILDLNTSQVTYVNNTTSLVPSDSAYKQNVSGSPTVQSSSSVTNIPVGTISSLQHIYLYYDLNPLITDLNTSINVVADYNLKIGTMTIPYHLHLGSQIPMCVDGTVIYNPPQGIFNIVDDDYYNGSNTQGGYYNNLPTQVVKRPESFQVLSLDSADYNTLQDSNRTVFVDMIDASAFHDVNASCDQLDNNISSLEEMPFTNENKKSFSAGTSWFSLARPNAAFRVSYNVAADGSDFNITRSTNGAITIENFPDFTGKSCSTKFYPSNTSVSNVCKGGVDLSRTQYDECMKCIYGYHTKFICSQDNFAIRPAAFNITLKDQSQRDPTHKSGSLTSSYTGITSPITGVLNLAAGYQYDLNVTAVNAQDNNPSPGYYTSLDNVQDNNASYLWAPPAGQTTSGCNDDDNKTFSLSFVNGNADMNTSLNQVGRYIIHLIDSTWTAVDQTNHSASWQTNFDTSKYDCAENSSTVQATGSTSLNGCDISSDAVNNVSGLQYRDINVIFHPYWFDMTGIVPSLGIDHNTAAFATTENSFVYMSDMAIPADENMSFHLNGPIKALGENNATLSNFVSQCYAVPIELNVSKTAITTPPAFEYRFNDFNSTDDNISTISGDMNTSVGTFVVNDRNFTKDNKGALHTTFNLNFARDQRVPTNPQRIKFLNYQAKCQTSADCTFQADLNSSKKTSGSLLDADQNKTVTFYYGRTHAPRYKFQGNAGTAKIYYEVYCDKDGNRTILPNGIDTNVSVDGINWYNNQYNVDEKDGDVETVSEQRMTPKVATSTPTTTSPSTVDLQYNGNNYPYQTTMENNASGWLIYNPYNAATKVNTFNVEFYKADTNWTGVQGTHTSTDANASSITNQRIMW